MKLLNVFRKIVNGVATGRPGRHDEVEGGIGDLARHNLHFDQVGVGTEQAQLIAELERRDSRGLKDRKFKSGTCATTAKRRPREPECGQEPARRQHARASAFTLVPKNRTT